jgi:hypothetical protein
METQKKVVSIRDAYALKRGVLACEIPVSCVDVAAFVRALYEPEILAMIEQVQERTLDD